MKKHSTVYTEDSITYWPIYTPGVGTAIWMGIIGVMGLVCLMLLADEFSAMGYSGWIYIIMFVVIVIGSFFSLPWVWKYKDEKTRIDCSGIDITSPYKRFTCCVKWSDVSEIHRYKDYHYGVDTYRIYYNSDNDDQLKRKKKRNYIVLSLYGIDEAKLKKFFPSHIKIQLHH